MFRLDRPFRRCGDPEIPKMRDLARLSLVTEKQVGHVFVGHDRFGNDGPTILPDLTDRFSGVTVVAKEEAAQVFLLGQPVPRLLCLGKFVEFHVGVNGAGLTLIQEACMSVK